MKENLERLFLPDYMPTNLDILHCRLKTTGITETLFQLGQLSYRYSFPELNCFHELNWRQGYAMSAVNDPSGGNGFIASKMSQDVFS